MASDNSSVRPPTTANDRFKRGYPRSTYIGITAAVAVHFVLFQFSPQLTAAGVPIVRPPFVLVLPPVVAVPPPPAEIARQTKPASLLRRICPDCPTIRPN